MESVTDSLRIFGDQEFGVVAADDLVWGVAEQVADFGVGEGKVSFWIEHVDEIRIAFYQGPIASLRQGQLL